MMQKRILTATLMLCAALLVVGLLPIHGEADVYDTVVRLHVIANSDSEEDQALKLKVRDAVLGVTTPLLSSCSTREQAQATLVSAFGEIQAAAEAIVKEAGRSDKITLALDEETYPERDYDGFCFPSGTYLSMRVCIGDAAGQNWWCCLFPPLCMGSATATTEDAEDAFIAVGMTPSQYKIITASDRPVYRIRFKLLEVLGGRK